MTTNTKRRMRKMGSWSNYQLKKKVMDLEDEIKRLKEEKTSEG